MNRETAHKGRISLVLSSLFITSTILSGISFTPKLVLSISLPAITTFLCSCQKEQTINPNKSDENMTYRIPIECKSDSYEINSVSILTFRSDSLGRLESYQHIDNIRDGKIWLACSSGPKTSYVYANLMIKDEDIARISTVNDLDKFHCNLEDTTGSSPFMSGVVKTDEWSGAAIVHLKPMISEITLHTIKCNFAGTPYEGEELKDASIYLVNVNAQCSLGESSYQVQRFVNMGGLNPNDLRNFRDPGIIWKTIQEDIGKNTIHTDISLYCFHNIGTEEGPGSPFTRLVLEGKIQGETYYWPISINRATDGEGIRSNTSHIYNLTIRRKGSLDPDAEMFIKDCNIAMEWEEWKEKEEYVISF